MTIQSHKELLRAVGLKATPARLRVLAHLAKTTKPVDVSALKRQLSQKAPNTVTLYRMMQDFLDKGLVRRVDLGQGNSFFELATHTHHHHIICTECGYIEDFSGCAIASAVKKAQAQSTAFAKVTDHSFELFGICKKCTVTA